MPGGPYLAIWSRAGVWGRLHETVLARIDKSGLLDLTRVVLDSAHVGAKKGAHSQAPAPWTGVNRIPRCTSSRTRTNCPGSSASPPPAHDSQGLKPMMAGLQSRHDPTAAGYLAFLGLAAALCCYKLIRRITT